MKYVVLICFWSIVLGSAGLFSTSQDFSSDPTDDLSFTWAESAQKPSNRLIPENQMTQILKDRIDLFPQSQIFKLSQHLIFLCHEYRFDPAFILSLIEVESGFRIRAKSPAGALGLMQIQIPTGNFVLKDVGVHLSGFETFKGAHLSVDELTPEVLLDPFVNTAVGMAYLAWLRDHYEGFSPYYVLAAYNVGPGRMDALLSQKSFRPRDTGRYFRNIRQKVPSFQFY